MPFIMEMKNNTIRDKMNQNFNLFFQKNKHIISKEKVEEKMELNARNEEIESSFGIPMIICAHKSDTIEALKDERLIDHIQYNLRSFALKYGSSLFYTSVTPHSNILRLADYLSFLTLGKENTNLEVRLDDQLFIPAGYDQADILKERFKDSMDYLMARDNLDNSRNSQKGEEKVMEVQEFLGQLKEGKTTYSNSQADNVKKESIFESKEIFKQLNLGNLK